MYKINLAYFSCGRDEEMLRMSIEAGRRHYDFNKIYIFSDPNDPIKPFGFELGNNVIHTLRTFGTEKLYGLDNIKEMHSCLKFAAKDCDYVLKKDSDVLDCSNLVYKNLNSNNYDAYGCFPMARENLIPEKHFNGNAYFIRSSLIGRFPDEFPTSVHNWAVMNYPEDMVTSAVCNELSENIKIDGTAQSFDGDYLFDVYLTRAIEKEPWEISKYGFAHCRSNTRIMKYLNQKLYGNN